MQMVKVASGCAPPVQRRQEPSQSKWEPIIVTWSPQTARRPASWAGAGARCQSRLRCGADRAIGLRSMLMIVCVRRPCRILSTCGTEFPRSSLVIVYCEWHRAHAPVSIDGGQRARVVERLRGTRMEAWHATTVERAMLSWSLATGSTRSCHPRAGAPHYSVVSIQHVLHDAPALPRADRRARLALLPCHRQVGPVNGGGMMAGGHEAGVMPMTRCL